jgi:xylulose-5-phosphate/fructose-6-phosphate phosphoketolase
VVLASCGDVATMEALAAAAILRQRAPDLKLRFVNVVDLFKLQPASEHPHGSTEREFDSLFTRAAVEEKRWELELLERLEPMMQ